LELDVDPLLALTGDEQNAWARQAGFDECA
jgi:hypothetical protein